MRFKIYGCLILMFFTLSQTEATAQILGRIKGKLEQIDKASDKLKDIEITEEEEIKIGEDVSARIRARYGVVQDVGIHRYVSLVGSVVTEASRSSLPFQFIVLDTDGVNAFAAPGGFIHITRGALSLMKSEAELAGVLSHEIAHVTEKHTIRAIQKGKVVQMVASQKSVSSDSALFQKLKDEAFKIVFAGFSREDELDADEHGIAFTAASGYAPASLSGFLLALKERNADSIMPQGLFASHPEMEERLRKLDLSLKTKGYPAGVDVQERFTKNISYQPIRIVEISVAEEGASGLAEGNKSGSKKKEEEDEQGKKRSRFSLSSIRNPLSSKGSTTQSAEVTGSGGSRGIDRERGATGGANPSLIQVRIEEAELIRFKEEGKLL